MFEVYFRFPAIGRADDEDDPPTRSNVAAYILKEQGFTNITNGIHKHQVTKLLPKRAA